jgi:L-serine dehydratase
MAPHRSALEAYGFLGGPPETAHVQFLNSFSTTGTGHRSHIAIAAGLLGMDPKDPRFASALALASEQGLEIFFEYEIDSSEHPNTIIMDLRRGEKELSMKVQSTGGGNYTISADCTGQSIRRKAGPLC